MPTDVARLIARVLPKCPLLSLPRQNGQDARVEARPELTIRQPIGIRIYGLVFGLVWCGLLLAAIVGTASSSEPGSVVPLAAMLAFGVTICWRTSTTSVKAEAAGLLVRNYFSTKRFAWSEVEDFRVGGPMFGLPIGRVVHLLLRNREVVTLDATMRSWLLGGSRQRLDSWVEDLRGRAGSSA